MHLFKPGFRIASRGMCLLSAGVLSGCASVITDQVESDIALVNSCQEIQANQAGYVPVTKKAFIELVRHRVLGDVVLCDDAGAGAFGKKEVRSVLFCGLNEDVEKSVALKAKVFENFALLFKSQLSIVNQSTRNITSELDSVTNTWSVRATPKCATVALCAVEYSAMLPSVNAALVNIIEELENIAKAMDAIEVLANSVEASVLASAQQDQILLLADIKRIVANAKNFLNTAQRALKGDVAMLTRDAIINNLYYQFSNKILDALDTSLVRAEKVLDKADERLYGSVSLAMFFSRKPLQSGFDSAIIGPVCKASNGKPPHRAAFAIAQAVCERVGDPDRSSKSFLAPMIGKSFVKAVGYANKNISALQCPTTDKKEVEASQTAGAAPIDTLPFSLYLAHEWATGLALTTVTQENISAKESALRDAANQAAMAEFSRKPVVAVLHPAAAAASAPVNSAAVTAPSDVAVQKRLVATLPTREAVRRLALSSSAAAITEFESARSEEGYAPLQGYLADAASVRSVVATFLSVQSQSTFVSVNSNMTQNVTVSPIVAPSAPQVYVIPWPSPQSADFDICANLPAAISCRKIAANSYEILASQFGVGAFQNDAVQRVIGMLGGAIARSAKPYDAYISGFASMNEFSCQGVAKWGGGREPQHPFAGAELTTAASKSYQLAYRSADGFSYFKASCDNRSQVGGNAMLSFARAAWAGSRLEAAPGAQVRIMDVVGVGADYAATQDTPDDRAVRIRLVQQ